MSNTNLAFKTEDNIITGTREGFGNLASFDNGILCLSEGPENSFSSNFYVYFYNVIGTTIKLNVKVDFGAIYNKSPFLHFKNNNLLVVSKDGSPSSFDYQNGQLLNIQDLGMECIRTLNEPYKCSTLGTSYVVVGDLLFIGDGDATNNDNLPRSGTVSIFLKTNNLWKRLKYLTASDQNTEDHFGTSISVSGDYILVGAPGNDDNGKDIGSIYLFQQQGLSDWVEIKKIISPIVQSGLNFGHSVILSENNIIVGAPNYNVNQGAVIVYNRLNFTVEKILKAGNSYLFGDVISFYNNKLYVASQIDLFEDNCGVFVYNSRDRFELIQKFGPSERSISAQIENIVHTPKLLLVNISQIGYGNTFVFYDN